MLKSCGVVEMIPSDNDNENIQEQSNQEDSEAAECLFLK